MSSDEESMIIAPKIEFSYLKLSFSPKRADMYEMLNTGRDGMRISVESCRLGYIVCSSILLDVAEHIFCLWCGCQILATVL
jgi:hypothetical protein